MAYPAWRRLHWASIAPDEAPREWYRLLEEMVEGQPDDVAARRAGLLPEDLSYVLSLAYPEEGPPHAGWAKWAEKYQKARGERDGVLVDGIRRSESSGAGAALLRVVAPDIAARAQPPEPAQASSSPAINLIFTDPRPSPLPPVPRSPVLEAEYEDG